MSGNGNPVLGLFGLSMFLLVVFALALLLGGIYLLYSIGRAADGLERMADSAEEWVAHLKRTEAASSTGGYVLPRPTPAPARAVSAAPTEAAGPQAFIPGANNPGAGGLS